MKTFPEGIRFKYPWRGYQQRVLDQLDAHIHDGHLHIVAPPGSGKTVLGLEAAVRLNRPTLILSPTITIRNQWVERLCQLFLDTDVVPGWISADIRKPAFLTVSTYQGLHAACCLNKAAEVCESGEGGEDADVKPGVFRNKYFEEVVAGLEKAGVGTLIIDEAHHLRNEWWNTLTKVKYRLDPVTVGLTATPPYDVSHLEWKRYMAMNGPIDAEIPVPELVRAGDLCPHHDHIYFSCPTHEEQAAISEFRSGVHDIYTELCGSGKLEKMLSGLPVWREPDKNLEWIYANFPVYSSMLIFLNSRGADIPGIHYKVVGGDSKLVIPPMDYTRLEHLLNFALFSDHEWIEPFKVDAGELRKRLAGAGVLENRKVCLTHNTSLDKTLASSLGKLDSIERIVEIEYGNLGHGLRMVVLTDFIRNEYLNCTPDQARMINKIGVVPIFQRLRLCDRAHKKIGVLTGSLVIIPAGALETFNELGGKHLPDDLPSRIKPYDGDFAVISLNDKLRNRIVAIVTRLFQQGEIEVLIGTKALLGEGWDAPEINSLVMASFVGSFVLSNQMRGRAIRTSRINPDKCSNIWHLVCLDPTDRTGGGDLEVMERRFRTFVGISNSDPPSIENGIKRLGVVRGRYRPEDVDAINAATVRIAADRTGMKERWHTAIGLGNEFVEEIKIPYGPENENGKKPSQLRKMYTQRTVAYVVTDLAAMAAAYMEFAFDTVFRSVSHLAGSRQLYALIVVVFCGGIVFLARKTYRTARLMIKYRDISKDVANIADALLDSLIRQGVMQTEHSKLSVNAYSDDTGAIYCSLDGGTVYEQSLFVDCLDEIVNVIDNPKYIIIRYSKFLSVFTRRDYHSVPEVLGRNRESARYFESRWKRHVGNCRLIYTRTVEGRQKLVYARVNSLSAQLSEYRPPEQVNKWR